MNDWRGLVTGGYSGRRLLLGAIVGIAVGFATEDLLRLPFRFAAGWVAAVAVFLLLTVAALGRAAPEDVRRRARRLDSRRWVILALVVAAAAISLLALGASFGKAANETGGALTLRLEGEAPLKPDQRIFITPREANLHKFNKEGRRIN